MQEPTKMRRVTSLLEGHELTCYIPDTLTPEAESELYSEMWTDINLRSAERAQRLREWRDRVHAYASAAKHDGPTEFSDPPRNTGTGRKYASLCGALGILALLGGLVYMALYGSR